MDVDDVLAQTGRMFLDLLASGFGQRLGFHEIRSYHLGDSFGLGPEELEEFMRQAHRPDRLEAILPMPGAAAVLERWRRRGCEILVVTGRPPETRRATLAWLERHAVPFSEFHFLDKYSDVYRGGAAAPGDVLSLADLPALDLSLAVEDFPGTAEHLACDLEVPVALFDRPWNRRLREGEAAAGRLVRCRDWDEIGRRFPDP